MAKFIRFSEFSQSLRCFSKGKFSEVQNQFFQQFCNVNQNIPISSNFRNLSEENMKDKQNNLPPEPPNPADCCEDGCANCVWFNYVTEVKFYYKNDNKKLQEAFEIIPNVEHREFVKISLKELETERTSSP
nr:UPF0651 protein YPL107W, mitochondrial-like [Parasteatoda tepidariorum]